MDSNDVYAARLIGYTADKDGASFERPPGEKRGESEDQSSRSSYQRDVDRIKYTEEFRRLKDVTQVARAGESYLYHDRLTHSLKVAQVGKRFADYIINEEVGDHDYKGDEADSRKRVREEIDPSLVEAACLAHDLGHPPFGHLAEETLDELLQEKTNPFYENNDLEPSSELRSELEDALV
jgi:dGTPase